MLSRRWYDGGYYARNVQLTSANCSSLNLIRIRRVPCGGFRSTPEEVLSFTFTMLVSRSKIAQLPNVDSNHTCREAWLNCIQSLHRSGLTIVYARARQEYGKSVIDSFKIFQWQLSWSELATHLAFWITATRHATRTSREARLWVALSCLTRADLWWLMEFTGMQAGSQKSGHREYSQTSIR